MNDEFESTDTEAIVARLESPSRNSDAGTAKSKKMFTTVALLTEV
jgi:hypothetical protein